MQTKISYYELKKLIGVQRQANALQAKKKGYFVQQLAMNATKAVPLLKLYQILIPEQLESKSRNGLHVAIKSKCDSVVSMVVEKIDKEVVSSSKFLGYDSGPIFVPTVQYRIEESM